MCLIDPKILRVQVEFQNCDLHGERTSMEKLRAKMLSTEMGEMLTIQEHRTARRSKQALCAQLLTQVTGLPP
jgi:hypothetical protein